MATAADYAARNPPTCVRAFSLEVIYPGECIASEVVRFALGCASCGGAKFQILSHPRIAPDPSPYDLVAPGEIMLLPPHRLRCIGCGATHLSFDARTQGYDGVLNGGCSYPSGEGEDQAADGHHRVTVGFGYGIDLAELAGLASEAGVSPADLFDSFSMIGQSEDGSSLEIHYECG